MSPHVSKKKISSYDGSLSTGARNGRSRYEEEAKGRSGRNSQKEK